MTRSSRRGVTLLLEGLVVLVSILAAFFLEGWRADRELARDLNQELVSVRVELQRNRDMIGSEVEALERVTTGGAALIEALQATDASSVSVPDTLVFLGTQWHLSFSPSLGAVRALISSGRLAQIANEDLRLGLAGLDEAVNDALEEQIFARQISVEQLLPLMGERGDLSSNSRIAEAFFGFDGSKGITPQERSIGKAVPTEGTLLIPNSPAIRNAAIRRLTWYNAARAEFMHLSAHLTDLIDLVSEEVG